MSESLAQRRLTAIVAVDLAGFSRRAEANEDGAVRAVAALSNRVAGVAADHGGRVFNTAGDGFMLEFQTVSGALEAADLLASGGDVRVGVHLGEVSVTPTGDLLGHGVNVAARLQALADPGSVIVSGDAQRAVRGGIAERLRPRGRIRLDKMKEAIPVFVLAPAAAGRPAPRLRRRPLPWLIAGAAVLAALAAGGAVWWLKAGAPAQAASRIAVLPLEALSDRPDGKAFARGAADQIVTTLSANGIQAISAADADVLRGPDRQNQAKKLGAAVVLDGVVQDFGDNLDIRVHLDDPARHAALWSTEVTGPRDQAPRLQARVAQLVVNTLGCSSRAFGPGGLSDPVLLGRYLHACDIFANADFSQQKIYALFADLKAVTAGAPSFAPAHSDLAKFSPYFMYRLPPSEEAGLRRQGAAEARIALALDPKSPDARLAQYFLLPPTVRIGGEALLRKAVADAPDWPHTNGFLGQLLFDTGRVKDGLGFLQKASAAPLDIDWKPITSELQVCGGQPGSGLADLRRELAVEGDNATDRNFLMEALQCAGQWREARDLLRAGYAQGVVSLGDRAQVDRIDAFLTAMITGASKDKTVAISLLTPPPRAFGASSHAVSDLAALGDIDGAFRLASASRGGLSGSNSKVLFFPAAAPLRRDPRFITLAARIGLVDYWKKTGAWPDFCAEPGLPYDCKAEAAKLK